MKALVYTGSERIELRDVPDPTPAPGEALVRVAAVGVCGSDMHAFHGHDPRRPAPLILGHEAAGAIVSSAEHAVGTRVTINPLVSCGTCEDCRSGRDNLCPQREIISLPPREGAFAELVAIPDRNLVPVPDGVTLEAAALAEPIACGWHALRIAQRTAVVPPNETRVLVLGGGAIGVGAALCARAQGYRDVTVCEPYEERRAALDRIDGIEAIAGADAYGTAAPPHLVVDAVGYAATRASACAVVRPGGTIVHIGLGSGDGGVDARRMTLQEIAFIGTYTYTSRDFRDTAEAIFSGRLGSLDWIDRQPLAAGPDVFGALSKGQVASPKVVLIPG